jgi:hypothetical protein
MSEKTIQETEASFGERAAGILRGWYQAQDEITRSVEPVEGPHADILTDGQRAGVVRTQKAERARQAAEGYREQYRKLTEERNAALRTRTSALREMLFKTPDTDALSRAALASDAGLGAMLVLAAHADNKDLAHAVFVAADQRGLGDLLSTYFERIDPDARPLYEEFKAAPSEEVLERRLADAETLFAAPEASHFATVPTF